jgi:hypothetical protein
MIFRRRRAQLARDVQEARAIREESEASLREVNERVRVPLREIRAKNHVAADVVKVIREGHRRNGPSTAHS